jgi:hypothetical protein
MNELQAILYIVRLQLDWISCEIFEIVINFERLQQHLIVPRVAWGEYFMLACTS